MPKVTPLTRAARQKASRALSLDDMVVTIRIRAAQQGIDDTLHLAKAAGIPYQSLRRRMARPEMFTAGEILALCDTLRIPYNELLGVKYECKPSTASASTAAKAGT